MTQAALVTLDIERLTSWYEKMMALKACREVGYVGNPRMAEFTGEEIEQEYQRMSALGVEFVREPALPGDLWQRSSPLYSKR